MFRRCISFGGFSLFSSSLSPTAALYATKQIGAVKQQAPAAITYQPEDYYKKVMEHRERDDYVFDEYGEACFVIERDYFIWFLECSVKIPANSCSDVKIRSSQTAIGALDAVLKLPEETARKFIWDKMDFRFIKNAYQCKFATVEMLEKLFSVIERVAGADELKCRLELVRVEYVVKCEHLVVAHFFDTLKRLDVDWNEFFLKQWKHSQFLDVVSYPSSPETLKMVIDICRGVSDEFMKSLLEPRPAANESACYTPLNYACLHGHSRAVDFVRILIDLLQELFGTTAEMFKQRVFTVEEFRAACSHRYSRSELVTMLVNAGGVEQLTCDSTSFTPLQYVTRFISKVECIRSFIERCRKLGGSELIRKQLETSSKRYTCLPFTYSFSPYFRTTVVQYFIEVMKHIGMDFFKKQLFEADEDGNTLFLKACENSCSEENIEFVLNDVFKANNFTDAEILAHFQYRRRGQKNALLVVCSTTTICGDAAKFAKVKLLTAELLRIQQASGTLHDEKSAATPPRDHDPHHPSPRTCRSGLVKDMLEQTCLERHCTDKLRHVARYTPSMYALRYGTLKVIEFLLNLYRDESGASEDDIKSHVKQALRSCFLDQVSMLKFDFIWKACLDFRDDAFLKSALDWNEPSRTCGEEVNVLYCASYVPEMFERVLPYLIKFDLFDAQLKVLPQWIKSELAKIHGIDESTPSRMAREREKEVHLEKSGSKVTKGKGSSAQE